MNDTAYILRTIGSAAIEIMLITTALVIAPILIIALLRAIYH